DFWMRVSWTWFHVPAFLLMAGMLMRRDGVASRTQLRLRLERVVVPYLVALGVLMALRWVPAPPLAEFPFAVVLASPYGVYYFIPVFVLCTLFGWMVSRTSEPAQWAIAVALLACAACLAFIPGYRAFGFL